MAHMIDQSNGMNAIAYVGTTPWHGLGQALTPGASLDTWRKEAGLDYEVLRTTAHFESNSIMLPFVGKDILYRSDTLTPLSVVGNSYNVVQPTEVLEFFGKLAEIGGFELETAGVLSNGKRIWALAKVNDGAPVIGHDVVRPYVLLATSYDGTMATIAKFTAIRVVCNNTIAMAVGAADGAGKLETDTEGKAVSSLVRVTHNQKFDPGEVRRSLGIAADIYDKWLINTRLLAERGMSVDQADVFTCQLISPLLKNASTVVDVRKSKPYKEIMNRFTGGMIGGDLTGGLNRWRMLNAVTEYTDWARGRSVDTRLQSAWFGDAAGVKDRAYSLLAAA
jgi:phage/plasmid-like protein (TIGR03299 family)